MNERTLVLIKPDGVQRLLTGRILARYEDRGLKLVALKLIHVSADLAERHYAVHREKPFFRGLVDFITSAPLVAAVLEGPNAIAVVRAMNGATRPHEAAPGSIRGDFALETAQNLVHASDSPENAAAEIELWFAASSCTRTSATSTAGCSPRASRARGSAAGARRWRRRRSPWRPDAARGDGDPPTGSKVIGRRSPRTRPSSTGPATRSATASAGPASGPSSPISGTARGRLRDAQPAAAHGEGEAGQGEHRDRRERHPVRRAAAGQRPEDVEQAAEGVGRAARTAARSCRRRPSAGAATGVGQPGRSPRPSRTARPGGRIPIHRIRP